MRGAQQMIDIGERGFGQRAQRLARHHQHFFAQDFFDAQAVCGDFAVGRCVLAEREERGVLVGGRGVGGEGGVHGVSLVLFHLVVRLANQ